MQTRSESEIGHCVENTSKKVAEQSKSSSGSYVGASAAKRGWTLDESRRCFATVLQAEQNTMEAE
jgi:hypothetical protein